MRFRDLICCDVLFRRTVTGLLVLAPFTVSSQLPKPQKDITPGIVIQYRHFKERFGSNKEMPPRFEKQILYALSYFPELSQTNIRFRLNRSGLIATRPGWLSVFKRPGKRQYIVFINDAADSKSSKYLLRNAGPNGQVGIIGHELTHIVNFGKKSTWGLLSIGVGHVSRRYMDRFENKTDSVCVERGLGYQLIDWNIFLRKAFGVPDPENAPDPFMKDPARERYMSPATIRRLISKTAIYQ